MSKKTIIILAISGIVIGTACYFIFKKKEPKAKTAKEIEADLKAALTKTAAGE